MITPIHHGSQQFRVNPTGQLDDFELFVENFAKYITAAQAPIHTKDTFVEYCLDLVKWQSKLARSKIQSYCQDGEVKDDCIEVIDAVLFRSITQLNTMRSEYKRNTTITEDTRYVPATAKAIGSRWELKENHCTKQPEPTRVQSICQYVSIIQTLQSLFMQPEFSTIFFQSNREHICQPGVYEKICCGETCKNNPFFSENPNAIMIQIFTDDFEPCAPLLNKAGLHKTCAYYMRILNMPTKYLSRLDNIYLLCLCNAGDLKSSRDGHTKIHELIVDKGKLLETEGIKVRDHDSGEDVQLRGAIVSLGVDNLGANAAYGLIECFSICEMKKNECDTAICENPEKFRTHENHQKAIEYIKNSDVAIDYNESRGVKHDCKLNELQNFSILKNYCIDIV